MSEHPMILDDDELVVKQERVLPDNPAIIDDYPSWQPSSYTRTVERDPVRKRALIGRISKIEGQIRGVKRLLEEDRYCPNILIQASAADAALRSFNRELLKDHIESCVVNDIKNDNEDAVQDLEMLIRLITK